MIDLTSSDRKRIGSILKQLRDAYGLEDRDISDISGVKLSTVSGILNANAHSPEKIEKIASAFGFSSLDDLQRRGEKVAAEVAAGQSAYMGKTAAAITKIMQNRDITLTAFAPTIRNQRGTAYTRTTLSKALGERKQPKHFRLHQLMVRQLGLSSTDDAIRLADTLPTPQSRETFDYERVGKALHTITLHSDVHHVPICQIADISRSQLSYIFEGDRRVAVDAYERVAQALNRLGALDRGDCARAVEVADYLDHTLMHRDHFPEILKAYRTKRDMNLSELGAIVYPNMNETTRGNEMSKLEKDETPVSDKVAWRVLSKLGYENMHQLIHDAGLDEKYPNPGMGVVAQGLSAHIDRLMSGVREEQELDFSLQELARRQAASAADEPKR